MRRLLLHSTLVFVVLLLSAAASHAEERKASVLVEGRKARRTREEADLHDEGEEDEEGGEEAESQGLDQQDKADFLVGARSRMILSNALQSSSSKYSESPEDAKKQREMAQRVRELLSRLPIIPLSQHPVLHKETLVAAAPAPASGATDDPAAAVASTPMAASHAAGGLVFRDPAGPAHAARFATSHHMDKNAFVSDELPDERVQTALPAASVTTPLYVGRPDPQDFPGAFGAGEQADYRASELALPYIERSDDAAAVPGTTGPQPGKGYPSLADVSRGDLHIPEAQHIGAPVEFVQLFGIMNALSTLVDWVDNMKQELNSRDSDPRATGGEDLAEEKDREEDTEKESGEEDTIKKQGGEEVTEDANAEKKVKKAEGGYKTLRFGHHPEN